MTVTGTQLERMIQRGRALAADVRQRYESSSQKEPTTAQPVKKRKMVRIILQPQYVRPTGLGTRVMVLRQHSRKGNGTAACDTCSDQHKCSNPKYVMRGFISALHAAYGNFMCALVLSERSLTCGADTCCWW